MVIHYKSEGKDQHQVWESGLSYSAAKARKVQPDMLEVTPEEVGVLKVLKLAVEMDKFSQRLEAEGRDTYTLGEISEKVIMPVLKL